MRRKYQLVHEILHCTKIEYDHLNNIIVADDWWWDRKIQANKEFAKFHSRDCREIFHKYSQLFGDAYDSKKYTVSPSKLSKKGFDDDELWERTGNSDKLPANTEMREHAPSDLQGSRSAMDISGLHSGEKRKCSSGATKGKKKLHSRSALSESVEKLTNAGNELITAHLKTNYGPPSMDECMEELESFGVLEGDEKFHLFALSFFDYKSWCLKNAGAFDD
ncbi:Uncharacterized protein Adt_28373 [Abeliophyllum distichum]|uniref:Myb/SANT-like domain-containing protein n=1 Tax=Abeliophyllum distichum TaxID=126358 RepID=A0ABD1RWC4_9LAMI